MGASGWKGRAAPGEPPLRVLQVTPYDLDTNPYLRLLIEALEDRGADVRVAQGRSPVLLWRAVWRDGVPDVVHLQWHHRYFTSTSLPRAALRTAFFFLQWALLRLLGVRFVWTVHNILDHDREQPRWELFVCRRWARRVQALLVHCDEVVGAVADAYRIPTDRLRVVPHGRFPPPDVPPPERDRARRELNLPEAARVFVFFGRVRAYKGLEALLDAFGGLEASNARLVLLGYPDSEELGRRLEARAAGDPRLRTRFEFISPELLDLYLSAADLVVLPYRDLLTSGAAILAASRGRAVLAPALGCLRSLPPDAAILYPANASDGLARGLHDALDAHLDAMGAAAREHVDRFPWSATAAETEAVYRDVLGRRR